MSLSNPTPRAVNPCTRWFEWDGSKGGVRYYDKAQEKNIPVLVKFQFILLDQLATIGGWCDASDSGIFSNEVRDTRQEVLVVKSFKGGKIAEGHYQQIKDRVAAAGGYFNTSLYLAYKESGELRLVNLQFKGAALNAWVDFQRTNETKLTKPEELHSVIITGAKDGQKGQVKYKTPVFALGPISKETIQQACGIDVALQEYLKTYFANTRVEQATTVATTVAAAGPSDAVADAHVDEVREVAAEVQPDPDGEQPF